MRKQFSCMVVLLLAIILWTLAPSGNGQTLATNTWQQPRDTAVHNIGPAADGDELRSYDCTPMSYRLNGDLRKTYYQGCFVQAAFGMYEREQGVALFNGTDEGEFVRANSATPSLWPLTGSATALYFGNDVSLYTYLPRNLVTRWNGTQRYKELVGAPEQLLRDSSGQSLHVNGQSLGMSGRGQWLIFESPAKSFIRLNTATNSILPFAPAYRNSGNPYAVWPAVTAITEDGRYAAVASNRFTSLKVYDLTNCSPATSSTYMAPQTCPYYDYWPTLSEQVSGQIRQIHKVQFAGNNVLRIVITTDAGRETYLLSPDGPVASLIPYLGLGDSFASGQGAFNYLPATDTADNVCHLSANGYPLRLSRNLFGNQGKSVACSGARMHDIANRSPDYRGQAISQLSARERQADGSEATLLHDFTPGYLAQDRFLESFRPGVISVQIGGNDAGFKDIMLRCLRPGDCYSTREDRLELTERIDRLYPKWVSLFRQLQATSPVSRVYVLGYPNIISTDGKCAGNAPLSAGDRAFARNITAYLNSVIKRAAAASGVRYVDIANALAGHELCSGSGKLAVNGISAGNDLFGLIGQESFHPNAYGHELLEQAILREADRFKDTVPKPTAQPATLPPVTPADEPTIQASASGRAVRRLAPGEATISYDARNRIARIRYAYPDNPLIGGSARTVTIGGTTVGTITVGSDGLSGTVTLPSTIAPGTYPIDSTGPTQSGDDDTIPGTIYIPASPPDFDDDGTPDGDDACPLSGSDDCTPPLVVVTSPATPSIQSIVEGSAQRQLELATRTATPALTVRRPSTPTLTQKRALVAATTNHAARSAKTKPSVATIKPTATKTSVAKAGLPSLSWQLLLAILLALVSTHYLSRWIAAKYQDGKN